MKHSVSIALLLGTHAAFAEEHAFFESKVRPILVEHCYDCHSGVNSKGGLLLDTKHGWEKGGDTGPAIVPGKPDESRLIQAVLYHDEDIAMPPKKKGGKLPDAVITDLIEWVKMGAPDPRVAEAKIAGMSEAEAKAWWAFQPLPKVDASKTIDDFLNVKLAEAKISSAPSADPRTLIRRLSYDLTGLPPSAEEVETFVSDSIRNPQSAISRSASSHLRNTACSGAVAGWMWCAMPTRQVRTPTGRSCMRGVIGTGSMMPSIAI